MGGIGTLTLQGDVSFRRGSRLAIDLDPRRADRLHVQGAARIGGGTLQAHPGSGLFRDGASYDVLVADGGRRGRFDRVDDSGSPVLELVVRYLRDRVRAIVERLPYVSLPALTRNQTSVAAALDGVVADGGSAASSVAGKLDFLPSDEIARAMTALDPEPLDVYPQLAEHWTEARFDLLTRRMRDAAFGRPSVGVRILDPIQPSLEDALASVEVLPAVSSPAPAPPGGVGGEELELWAYGMGLFGDKGSDTDVTGYSFQGSGAMLGFDLPLFERFRLGLAGTWQDTDVDFDRPGSKGRIRNTGLAVYGSYESGGLLFADLALQQLWNRYDTERQIDFAGVTRHATSDHEGRVFAAQGSVGLRAAWKGFELEPRVGVRYASLHQEDFEEEGAGDLNLAIEDRSSDGLESFVALRLAHPFVVWEERLQIVPDLHGEWSRETLSPDRDIDASFAGLGDASFTVLGDHRARDEWSVGLGVVAILDERLRLELLYDYQEGRDQVRSHAVRGGLHWSF